MATSNFEYLHDLEQKLLAKLDYLFSVLGVDIDLDYEDFKGVCPIHGDADNPTGFSFNLETGRWTCWTHKCNHVFRGTLIGFVRAILSRNNGWRCKGNLRVSFDDTIAFIYKFLETNVQDLPKPSFRKKHRKTSFKNGTLSRTDVRRGLRIPSEYFQSRGFNPEILDRFDIGECKTYGKRMGGRAVVPIYGFDLKLIGCTGRSIYEKCGRCNGYHIGECNEKYKPPKWLHSKGFSRKDWLFNLQNAAPYVRETKTIILVEAPMNVVRLAEASIYNAVALFGSFLTDGQKHLINCSGAENLLLLLDNDTAGREGATSIIKKCNTTFRIKNLVTKVNDISDMSVNDVKRFIYPSLEKFNELSY